MVAAPLLMVLGARLFLPAVGQVSVSVAVTREVDAAIVASLDQYVQVAVVANEDALRRHRRGRAGGQP